MLIQSFDSLCSKISHIVWHKDRELELLFLLSFFYDMIRIKFQIKRIGIYYFRWFQLDLESLGMSQLQVNQVLSVSLRFQGMTVEGKHGQCCHDSSSRWLQTIFPCCTALLCDSFNPSVVQLNILFTTNLMWHWDLSWSRPSRDAYPCASTHKRSPPGHTFTISQFMIIFSTVVNQFWTPADTNRRTDKWIHTAHIQ